MCCKGGCCITPWSQRWLQTSLIIVKYYFFVYCLIFAISIVSWFIFCFYFLFCHGGALPLGESSVEHIKSICPGWFSKDRPSSCFTYLIMFQLLVQLVLRRALVRVLSSYESRCKAVQVHRRGSKHKQQALSCLEVSLIPIDVSCSIFPCAHNTAVNPQPPNVAAPPVP